jgi:hypothetical protein
LVDNALEDRFEGFTVSALRSSRDAKDEGAIVSPGMQVPQNALVGFRWRMMSFIHDNGIGIRPETGEPGFAV